MENFRGDFSSCFPHSHLYSRILLLWKCFSKFVFILISILLIDVAIVIVVVAYLLHVQRAVAELWKIACLANNNNNSRRGHKVREEVYSAAKPKLSCPQTPFGGPLLTQSLWTRRRRSVECVDCGRVCSGDDEAAKAATTQSMRQMQAVYATLDASARIPASFDRHSQRERERKTQRENDDSALVIM